MSTKYIERRHDAAKVATGSHAGVGVEYSTNKIYVKPAPDVDRVELVDTSTAQTLTNKTLEAPTITNPTGLLRTARVDFVEDATSTSHTATVPIPAGAVIQDIVLMIRAAWTDTGATIDIGDTADPNGYIAAWDEIQASDVGTQYSLANTPAGTNISRGAYYAAADNPQLVGPTTSNFGWNYVAGSNLIITVNVATPSATTGRTTVVVYYTVPASFAPVLA